MTARKFVEERPDKFALAVGGVNLLRPVPALRELAAVVRDLPVAYTAVGPSFWGDGMYPPSDAVYYPLYAKCAELELPLCINTGLPGPPIPGEAQNPIHLDRVCVRFPELKLCMIHGADPWWDIAIRLLIKYQNLRFMTSAWSPKRLPESLLALHAHARQEQGDLRLRLAGAAPEPRGSRGVGAGSARRRAGQLSVQQRTRLLLRGPGGLTVTSLTAVAGSFFSRSVGCVTGQPGPQDVACGVFVGLGTVPTSTTSEYRLGDAVLFGCVPAGFAAVGGVPGIDLITMRPASSALARRIETNCPQPASEILRFSPVLAAAPLGRNWPGLSGSGTGVARRTMLAIARSSTAIRS